METEEYLVAKAKAVEVKTIAYLHDDTAFGTSLAKHVTEQKSKYGFGVTFVPYSPQATDVSTEVGFSLCSMLSFAIEIYPNNP
jgi:ABC-type branched-subunit amino acid transport system substrate-binding protein